MLPRLHRTVDIMVRPLNRVGTTLDTTFGIPVDEGGNPTAALYGESVTIPAQVSLTAYKAHRVVREGDRPATAGQATILAGSLPAVDLQDAKVESIAGLPVNLIVRELKPGAWTVSGRPAVYRAILQEADYRA